MHVEDDLAPRGAPSAASLCTQAAASASITSRWSCSGLPGMMRSRSSTAASRRAWAPFAPAPSSYGRTPRETPLRRSPPRGPHRSRASQVHRASAPAAQDRPQARVIGRLRLETTEIVLMPGEKRQLLVGHAVHLLIAGDALQLPYLVSRAHATPSHTAGLFLIYSSERQRGSPGRCRAHGISTDRNANGDPIWGLTAKGGRKPSAGRDCAGGARRSEELPAAQDSWQPDKTLLVHVEGQIPHRGLVPSSGRLIAAGRLSWALRSSEKRAEDAGPRRVRRPRRPAAVGARVDTVGAEGALSMSRGMAVYITASYSLSSGPK